MQRVAGFFTDLFVIKSTDFTTAVNNTAQSFTLAALAIGDIVEGIGLLEVKTVVAGLVTCTADVGVTGALTQYINGVDCVGAGAIAFVPAGSANPFACIAANKSLLATFHPGAAEALASATAGEVWIWARISRVADRLVTV